MQIGFSAQNQQQAPKLIQLQKQDEIVMKPWWNRCFLQADVSDLTCLGFCELHLCGPGPGRMDVMQLLTHVNIL